MVKLGIHAPTQGATQRFHDTASALKAEVFVWAAAENPGDAKPYPDALHVVRLPTPRPTDSITAYLSQQAATVSAWKPLDAVFIIGNEPTLDGGWTLADWLDKAPVYNGIFKQAFPGTRLASTPLTVAETPHLTTEAVRGCNFCAVHTYWEAAHPEDIYSNDYGASWRTALKHGAPLLITDPAQIARWLRTLIAPVAGVALFIADAEGEWKAKGYDVSPDDTAAIRLAYDTSPATPPEKPQEPPSPPVAVIPSTDPYAVARDPSTAPMARMNALRPLIESKAAAFGIPVPIAASLIMGESGGLIQAENGQGDGGAGLGQLTPPWHTFDRERNLRDPDYALELAFGFFSDCYKRTGNWREAFGRYGPHDAAGNPVQWYMSAGMARASELFADWGTGLPPVAIPVRVRVTGTQVILAGELLLGDTHSGTYDPLNGDHYWGGWCETYVESVLEHLGWPRVRYRSATIHGRSVALETVAPPDTAR